MPTHKPENTLHSKTFTFNLDGKDRYLYGECFSVNQVIILTALFFCISYALNKIPTDE